MNNSQMPARIADVSWASPSSQSRWSEDPTCASRVLQRSSTPSLSLSISPPAPLTSTFPLSEADIAQGPKPDPHLARGLRCPRDRSRHRRLRLRPHYPQTRLASCRYAWPSLEPARASSSVFRILCRVIAHPPVHQTNAAASRHFATRMSERMHRNSTGGCPSGLVFGSPLPRGLYDATMAMNEFNFVL